MAKIYIIGYTTEASRKKSKRAVGYSVNVETATKTRVKDFKRYSDAKRYAEKVKKQQKKNMRRRPSMNNGLFGGRGGIFY